ncbi:MAG: ATP-binding cassette domain-containing protein [Deltaproteobacteria bacterium]|nr:ATP-binding cassette domain-containing protein [Deltaproteobacteria bacterium]
MTDAVRAVELSKTYGTGSAAAVALSGVSLTIPRGTVAALLGPSGSGKSTLIKALGFVSPADTGEVYFEGRLVVKDGQPLADLAELRRRHLGFVFQKANLTSFLNARENVEIACEFGERPTVAGAPGSCSTTSRSPIGQTPTPRCSAAASSSAWPSPGPSPTSPR